MEARMLVGLLAAVAAFGCLFTGAIAVSAGLARRRSAMAAQGDRFTVTGLMGWRMRNGFAVFLPAARKMLRYPRVCTFANGLVLWCARRGWPSAPDAALTVAMAGLATLAVVVGVVLCNAAGAVACVLCALALMVVAVGNERDRRDDAVREAIPDALESMAACFGSGFTLLQTFTQVSHEVAGPLGRTFAHCAHVLETGGGAEEALMQLREGSFAPELAFVAVALDVQHQSGGAIRQVLASATEAVKGTLSLRRSLRVQTAQARLSARVVVVMPFVLVAAFSLVSPDFLAPFFSSALGYALLGLAVALQVAGIALVRRALSVDGVA